MLGINNVGYSYGNNKPSFGMALKMDPSAWSVIKRQCVAVGEKKKDKFFDAFKDIQHRQSENPVDICVRKANHRDALVAEVVDSAENPEVDTIDNKLFSQPFFFKNCNIKFLKKAEAQANNLKKINGQVDDLANSIPKATPEDFGIAVEGKNYNIDGEIS